MVWVPSPPSRGQPPPAWAYAQLLDHTGRVACSGHPQEWVTGGPPPAPLSHAGLPRDGPGQAPVSGCSPPPQIQKWGNVEWAHDYELQELRARTAAGTLFIHLCSQSSTVKHKLLQE